MTPRDDQWMKTLLRFLAREACPFTRHRGICQHAFDCRCHASGIERIAKTARPISLD
jgi:hypothetical protein